MGLFKKLNPVRIVSHVAKQVVKNPVSAFTSAVSTGGLSLVSPDIRKAVAPITDALVGKTALTAVTSIASARTGIPLTNLFQKPGGSPMSFNLGGFLGNVGTILGQSSIPGFQTAGQLATIGSQFVPQPTAQQMPQYGPYPQAQPVMAPAMRAAAVAGTAVATVGRSFFNKYPNLATAIQMLRNQGRNITRAKLYSAMKRFGPELLVSGGILTAAAVSELMVAGPGTRRMNPANSRALRRAAGRIRSFHKLCQHTDLLKTRHRRPCK